MPSYIADLNELIIPATGDFVLVRDVSDLSDRDKKMQLGKVPFKNGNPTAGRVARWLDANTVEDGGFLVSDIARLAVQQTYTAPPIFSTGLVTLPNTNFRTGGANSIVANSISVTAANTVVCSLVAANGTVTDYGGLLIIFVRASTSTTANSTSYILHVQKGSFSASGRCEQIGALGLLTGGSATQPSFTFTVDGTNNKLLASPIASTSGPFWFGITAIGHLAVAP